MIKQAGTAGYVSIPGRKIAAILLILICSFALAWATRSGGTQGQTSSAISGAYQPSANGWATCVLCNA